jgi:hypothetical protein
MVKHLVMWRMRREAGNWELVENRIRLQQAIDAIRSGIVGLKALEIGFNKSVASDASDVALYSEFETWEALQAYESHPLHEALKAVIGPLRGERRVVDYETSP